SKILGTLVREGFVRQDPPTGRFHLSWRLLAMAFGHAERVGMPAICVPILQALADETDELVQLAVVEDGEVLFVAKAEGPGQQIRMLPLIGLVAPAHATASGKVWLAHLPEAEALAVLARQGLRRLTPRTITSRGKLLAQLREARARGYAIVDEELVQGGRAAAAPIVAGGRMVGAVTDAVALGARFGEEGRFLAGGTDLIIQMRRGKVAPRHVMSLHRVSGLDRIEADGAVRLGALVTHRTIKRCPAFQGPLQALVESAAVVGGHQIRNVATVGGNIVNASPPAAR